MKKQVTTQISFTKREVLALLDSLLPGNPNEIWLSLDEEGENLLVTVNHDVEVTTVGGVEEPPTVYCTCPTCHIQG